MGEDYLGQFWRFRMGEDYLGQFWVVHWNSRWADQEPVTEDVFDRLSILEGLLRDVPPSSFVRPTLMTAQIDFLVGHMEGVWGDLAEGLRFQGNYASLYFIVSNSATMLPIC